jgi:hypothetical protein
MLKIEQTRNNIIQYTNNDESKFRIHDEVYILDRNKQFGSRFLKGTAPNYLREKYKIVNILWDPISCLFLYKVNNKHYYDFELIKITA